MKEPRSPVALDHPCDVCGLEPAVWGNVHMLGSPELLCVKCFSLWYEENVRDRAEMRRRRGVPSAVAAGEEGT